MSEFDSCLDDPIMVAQVLLHLLRTIADDKNIVQ